MELMRSWWGVTGPPPTPPKGNGEVDHLEWVTNNSDADAKKLYCAISDLIKRGSIRPDFRQREFVWARQPIASRYRLKTSWRLNRPPDALLTACEKSRVYLI